MKAISVREPWASLIRTGAKTYETRSWPTKYRGPLLICAAKGGLKKSELVYQLKSCHLQRGLGTLIGKPINSCSGVDASHLSFGKAVAIVNLIDCIPTCLKDYQLRQGEIHFGDFSYGRYAWKFKMVDNSFEPFPVKGRQGFFEVAGVFKLDCGTRVPLCPRNFRAPK